MGYIGRDNTLSTFTKQSITADGGTSFTLNQGVGDSSSILVSIGGIVQQPDVAYSASGTALTFTSAPTNAYPIWVIYLGKELTVTSETATDNVDSQAGTGDGTTTPVTLVNSVSSAQSIIVTLNGIAQVPGTDFTVSGTTLTFTSAPSAAMDILVYYVALSGTVNVPVDYSVTSASQFVSSGTWPTWNGAALTNAGGDATQADVDGLIAALVNLSFLQSVDHSTALLNFVNGWDDTFTVATSVDGEGFNVPMTKFDGTNDNVSLNTNTIGMVNGPDFLFSCIVNFSNIADGTAVTIITSQNVMYPIKRETSNKLSVQVGSASTADLGGVTSTSTFLAAEGNIHIQVAVNTATQTIQIVKNGVLETNVVTQTLNNGTISLIDGDMVIGSNGLLGQLWFGLDFLDLSVQANREKFVSGTGASVKAIDFGTDGSTPTGSQPVIYLNNPFGTFQNNAGSGGNFTEAGQLVDGGYINSKTYSSNSFTNSYELLVSYGKENKNINGEVALGASPGVNRFRAGQCITFATANTITGFSLFLSKQGSPSGTYYFEMMGATGSVGSLVGDGNILGRVDMGNISALSTTASVKNATFSEPILVPAGSYYFGAYNSNGDGSNYLEVHEFTGAGSTGSGNEAYDNHSGGWTAPATNDIIYYIYGSKNIDLITKGTDALTTVDSPATAPTKGHLEALVDEGNHGTSVWSNTLSTSWSGQQNISYRMPILSSDYSTDGDKIRVTLAGPVGTLECDLDNIAIVERSGTTANGTTTPTEILFGGTSGTTVPRQGSVVSDWLTYNFDSTKDYLLIVDTSSDTTRHHISYATTGGQGYYPKGSSNSYNVQNFSAVLTQAGLYSILFSKVEVGSASTITLNTDIIGEMSRDGGTTYSPVTLARSSTGIDGATTQILSGDVDFTGDPSGTNVVGRIRTVNKDKVTVDGISVNWS